jgi:polyphenol oxidase
MTIPTPPIENPVPFESPTLSALPGIRHGFFTRRGGVSSGAYASLNCGLGSGDDVRAVAENRARAMAAFGLKAEALATAYQVHSAEAQAIEAPFAPDRRPAIDGMATRTRGLALGVLAADCTPVLFAEPEARVIGVAHAGWRGALGGIVEATVAAMETLGARRNAIRAAIVPTIAQASYEVGPEFPAPFLARAADSRDFFVSSPRPGHYLFDLKGYVARRLHALGLAAVDLVEHDTYAEPTLFFSYRRATHEGERDYGRGLSAIALA